MLYLYLPVNSHKTAVAGLRHCLVKSSHESRVEKESKSKDSQSIESRVKRVLSPHFLIDMRFLRFTTARLH